MPNFDIRVVVIHYLLLLPGLALGGESSSVDAEPSVDIGHAAQANVGLVDGGRIETLWNQIKSSETKGQQVAIQEIARLRPLDRVSRVLLSVKIRDPDEVIRLFAVTALGRLGPAAGKRAAMELESALKGEDSEIVARRAVIALQLIDPQAAATIVSRFRCPENGNRWIELTQLHLWLGDLPGEETAPLRRALFHVSSATALGRKGIQRLIALTRNSDPLTRVVAIETLGMIGFDHRSDVVLPLLDVEDTDRDVNVKKAARDALEMNIDPQRLTIVRESAAPSMAEPGSHLPISSPLSASNLSSLAELLRSKDEQQMLAMRILHQRCSSEQIASVIVPLSMDPDPDLRDVGMSFLWSHARATDVAAPLAYALTRSFGKVHVIELVQEIDADDEYSPDLIPFLLRSKNDAIRSAGMDALQRISSQRNWRRLLATVWANAQGELSRQADRAVQKLNITDSMTRSFLIGCLAGSSNVEFAATVIGLAEAGDDEDMAATRLHTIFRTLKANKTRITILSSLAAHKPESASIAVPLLVAIVQSEENLAIRDQAIGLLGAFGADAHSSLPTLKRQLATASSTERQMVIAAAIKEVGAGNREVQAKIEQLESRLRMQHAFELLQSIISEQERLHQQTRRQQRENAIEKLKKLGLN